MLSFLVTAGVGLLIAIIGISNMRGNISTIHSYHRQRVTEENVKPFGRLVGLGTLIIGISLIVFGALSFIFEQTQLELLSIIATIELIAGLVTGTSLSFYAMKKYNGGIFS